MYDDEQLLGSTQFLRKANYLWFVMNFKLDNPGVSFESMGQEIVKGITYDKVKVSYVGGVTGKEQNDTYVLYVNPETKLVESIFLFASTLGSDGTSAINGSGIFGSQWSGAANHS